MIGEKALVTGALVLTMIGTIGAVGMLLGTIEPDTAGGVFLIILTIGVPLTIGVYQARDRRTAYW